MLPLSFNQIDICFLLCWSWCSIKFKKRESIVWGIVYCATTRLNNVPRFLLFLQEKKLFRKRRKMICLFDHRTNKIRMTINLTAWFLKLEMAYFSMILKKYVWHFRFYFCKNFFLVNGGGGKCLRCKSLQRRVFHIEWTMPPFPIMTISWLHHGIIHFIILFK